MANGGDDSLVEKIDNRQIMLALFIMRSSVSIATLPVVTAGDAAQDAWAAALVATIGTVLITLLIGGLGIRLSDKTPIEYTLDLLGKPLGSLVCAGFLLVLLHFAATEVRLYSEVLVGLFTPDTPIPFIIAVMVFLAAVAVYLGVETIGRTVDVLAPFYVLFVVLAMLGGLTKFDGRSLEPARKRCTTSSVWYAHSAGSRRQSSPLLAHTALREAHGRSRMLWPLCCLPDW